MQAVDGEPKWLEIARGELGQKELPGGADNPRIVEYLKATTLPTNMQHDETAWCASFVCWCLEQAGVRSTRKANARSYLDWGRPVSFPSPGCVAVFVRGANPAQGHVGFVVGVEPNGDILLLGGNQGNQVSIKRQDRGHLLSLRMPA